MADAADLDRFVRGVNEEEPVVADPEPQFFRVALERFEIPGAFASRRFPVVVDLLLRDAELG
jgi:hypothetical protein